MWVQLVTTYKVFEVEVNVPEEKVKLFIARLPEALKVPLGLDTLRCAVIPPVFPVIT